ncbi:protein kinase domain-containing protein [Solimonas aquatica]|uniref:protein kinase domain-containing protein n=1 Tax=Solimonas aquatica TaxID=489703 RepID=UPI0015A677F7|nr:winged helix-turn-helix domain-containing protein [Solimonas aquatica]
MLSVGGEAVRLEPKPLELLKHLLSNAGKVQTKDELFEAVWPGRVLTENVLTKAIARLRQVLGDHDQTVISTEYKYGYRLAAPVQVEWISPAPESPFPALSAGDRPPQRPWWKLERRLGIGGQGDVWLGVHEKTGERRVFKFALRPDALKALKREITLHRLLRESLSELAPIPRLIDWNLEEAPYFVESEWIEPGSVLDWLDGRELGAIDLKQRLELIAAIAEALASLHQVGVLHKDLKPANVLMKIQPDGGYRILLCDLGSGDVLAPEVLQKLQITMAGLSLDLQRDPGFATPLYLAPEILSGQAPTIKSDIYALGVMLYQFVVGDLNKPWLPGWEREVHDELLREDIAHFADGHPERRAGDAAVIAQALRTLPARHQQREADAQAKAEAQAAALALTRLRARRNTLGVLMLILSIGIVLSGWLYWRAEQQRRRADTAAEQAKAVSDYLSKDLFAPINDRQEPVMYMSVEQFLRMAAENIDRRLKAEPAIAADVHSALGTSFIQLHLADDAARHLRTALQISEQLDGLGANTTLRRRDELITMEWVLGQLRSTINQHDSAFRLGVARLGAQDPDVRRVQFALAAAHYWLGEWPLAEQQLKQSLMTESGQEPLDPERLGSIELELGRCQQDLDQLGDAERTLTAAIGHFSAAHGDSHIDAARARVSLGLVLLGTGRLPEARQVLNRALHDSLLWSSEKTWHVLNARAALAQLQAESGDPGAALPTLLSVVAQNDDATLDQSGPIRIALSYVLLRLGQPMAATQTLQLGIHHAQRDFGQDSLQARLLNTQLLMSLVLAGDKPAATELLRKGLQLDELPAQHLMRLQLTALKSALSAARGDAEIAADAVTAYRQRFGAKHWRTQLLEAGVAKAQSRSGP